MSDERVRDLHAYGGIVLVAVGASGFDWRVGACVLGLALAYLGIFHWRAR